MLIQEQYEVNIYIDKLSIFDAPGVVLFKAVITEAISEPIPGCEIQLSIPVGWLDQRSIVDGTVIKFEIKNKHLNMQENLTFRVFNIEKIELNQQFVSLDIYGLLDFYAGYGYSNNFNMYGNSSDVFKQICKAHNLQYEIDNTNDAQLWVAGENNLYQFMLYMSTYGWIDETSAMFWCMDRHKILLYKNLTTLFRDRSNYIGDFKQRIYSDSTEKEYSYSTASMNIPAGIENIANGGYGGEDNYFDLIDYNWKEVTAKKVIAESNIININKELSKGLAQSWYPFDVGNFHKNFYKAKKQNSRILSTYSTYIEAEASYFMPYRLGQIVNFELSDSQDINNKIKLASGAFIICGIEINISLKAITCSLQLAMQGLNGTAVTQEVY